MNRQSFFATFCGFLVILFSFSGCGGGRFSTPPNPGTKLQGVASVRTSLLNARGASEQSELVKSATVAFYEEGNAAPRAQTTTNDQGAYTLAVTLRAGLKGRIVVKKNNRQLSALVVPGDQPARQITRNVNLESTVVELALRDQSFGDVNIEAMEEQVRIGETSQLLTEVAHAFLENRPPVPDQATIAQTSTQLILGEQTTTKDCLTGQEWCLVMGKLEVSATDTNTYTSRLLLRRDRTDSGNSLSSEATVGAGHAVVQLPSGFSLQALSASANMLVQNSDPLEGNTVQITFLYKTQPGLSEAAKIADLTLTTTRTPTADDRLSVTSQRLLGVLNEKRSATPNSTPKTASTTL